MLSFRIFPTSSTEINYTLEQRNNTWVFTKHENQVVLVHGVDTKLDNWLHHLMTEFKERTILTDAQSKIINAIAVACGRCVDSVDGIYDMVTRITLELELTKLELPNFNTANEWYTDALKFLCREDLTHDKITNMLKQIDKQYRKADKVILSRFGLRNFYLHNLIKNPETLKFQRLATLRLIVYGEEGPDIQYVDYNFDNELLDVKAEVDEYSSNRYSL